MRESKPIIGIMWVIHVSSLLCIESELKAFGNIVISMIVQSVSWMMVNLDASHDAEQQGLDRLLRSSLTESLFPSMIGPIHGGPIRRIINL
jgi:hypothetical protein